MRLKFKRFISGILSLSMILSMFTVAHADEITVENMQATTFIKQGKVETLINGGDRFYQKTEYFDSDGTYTQPAKEHEISYSEYTSLRSNGSYDIHADLYQQTVDGVYVDMSMYRDVTGRKLAGAYIGRVIDGDFGEIETSKNNKTILINDNDEVFYIVEKFLDSNGNYTKDATYTMATVSNYNKVKDSEKFDYELQYTYELINDTPYKITGFYDIKGDPIIRPIIVEIHSVESMEEFFKEIDEQINPTPSETPGPNESQNPEESPNPNESPEPAESPEPSQGPGEGNGNGNGNGGNNGNGNGNENQPWGGSVFNWVDGPDTAMNSEAQNWADSWLGVTTDSSWFDSINGSGNETNGSDDVYNPGESEFGYIDDNGQFIPTDENGNVLPTEAGTFDENGNFTPGDGEGEYYDPEGVLHPATPTPSEEPGSNIDNNGNVVGGEVQGPSGINNPDGSFNQGGNGTINSEGNVNNNENIQSGGNFLAKAGSLMLDEFNRLYIKGNQETYDTTGLVTRPNGKTGYYSEDRAFNEGTVNLNSGLNGFYDSTGRWHSYNEFYITEDGSTELVLYPAFGMTANENKLQLNGYEYDQNGLTTKNNKTGYFNTSGDFIESNLNPYKNGFFDDMGDWIDDSLYTWDGNNLNISSAYFDPYGTFTVPNLDRGHFDATGKFVLGEKNVKADEGYYNYDGEVVPWGTMYTDSLGYIHETGKYGYWNENGDWVDATVVDGVNDNLGNFLNMFFSHFTPNGVIGHYQDKNVVKGYSIYQNGYYNAKGDFFNDLGSVLVDGKQYHYDKNKALVIGINVSADGYYDAEGNFMRYNNTIVTNDKKLIIEDGTVIEGMVDENGNIILPDGTVITPDGTIGHYDENGNFVEGETILPEGAYIDENGNIVMPDGTIIMPDGTVILPDGTMILPDGTTILPDGTVILPDGTVGHYDENGNFVEGLPEGAYIDENGNIVLPDGTIIMPDGTKILPDGTTILPDGTVILPDGTTVLPDGTVLPSDTELPPGAYIDENGNIVMPDGTIIMPDGTTILPDGTVILPDGTVGYYDENGNFVEGLPEGAYVDENGNIVLPDGTIIMPDGTKILPDGTTILPDGTVIPAENDLPPGAYIDENGNIVMPDGTIIMPDGTTILPDGTVILPDGTVGRYDENGNFVEGLPEGAYVDENGNIVLPDGTIIMPDGTKILPDGTIIAPDGTVTAPNSEMGNGYYDAEGNWHELPVTALPGGPTHYDENGNLVEGENPYEGGYYDADGNWHPDGENYYVDKDGNIHMTGDGTIGYIDEEGNFYPADGSGYYDTAGNFHGKDGQVGYYDKDGNFHEGLNPYEGGYYDAEGNWHEFGDEGYYDSDGLYHPSVTEEEIYHYDENGNLVEGENPYINGHYDENGNFIGNDGNPSDETPITRYYDENGNLIEGENPYEGGYYDSQGNWHADGEPGYFDKNGNYIQEDGSVGYFDSSGNYHEGTNPYQGGYYDAEGNWHPEGDTGYFDKNGNYHNADGQVGYYDANGVFHLGENPYEGGYYDAEGNWHPFGANGYYDANGVWHDQLIIDSRYAVGGSDYILYEGYFRDPMMRNRFIKEGNTIQFTVNKKLLNPIYVDTGFYVSANAVLEYDEAQDVLHGIAIGTGNTFVKDEDACILVYNGKVVSLSRDSAYVTVQKLKEMFVDTNVGIDVRKSRVGGKYAFVDAVETEQNITLNIDGMTRKIVNPLIVRNSQVYIALEEFEEESAFDMRMRDKRNEREVTLRRKNKAGMGITSEIKFTTNGGTISVESSLGTGELELINSPIMYNDKVYIPVNLLPQIVEKKVVWDSMNYQLCLTDYDY